MNDPNYMDIDHTVFVLGIASLIGLINPRLGFITIFLLVVFFFFFKWLYAVMGIYP